MVAFSVMLCVFVNAEDAQIEREITGKDGAPMVLIPTGEFMMGSPEGEDAEDEHPQHKVYLDAYYMDKHEVTVAQYRKFCETTGRKMPDAPSWGWIDSHPIVNVSWDDAVAYARYYGKRLPTEAEWEKACSAGSTTKWSFGDDESRFAEYAWYWRNSGDKMLTGEWDLNEIIPNNCRTQPVGRKKPNAWGLYDMHGNVSEWCADGYVEDYYQNSPSMNPRGPSSSNSCVLRGGGWYDTPDDCRSADRGGGVPSYWGDSRGFRCAVSASQ